VEFHLRMDGALRGAAVVVGASAGLVAVFTAGSTVVLLTAGDVSDLAAKTLTSLFVIVGATLGGALGWRRSSSYPGRDILRTTTLLLWGATLMLLPAFGIGLFLAPFALFSTVALVASRHWRPSQIRWSRARRVVAVAVVLAAASGAVALGLPTAG
jgi:uncharacterized membrane protein YfcA